MSETDYIRFLVAADRDPDLRAALRRAAPRLRTVGDLVAFAGGRGYRFREDDVPLAAAAARRPDTPTGAP